MAQQITQPIIVPEGGASAAYMGQAMPVLRVTGLRKQFGAVTAVQDVSFTVQPGDVFGFLGPNGSGKTTTVAMILGLIRPTAGHIELFGQTTPDGRYDALAKVGAIIESPAFYPFLTGRDNLKVVARLRKVPDSRIPAILDLVNLADRADRQYGAYSLGMKQRLAIGAALLNDPALLMLDEPTNGLDPEGMVEVRTLIQRLAGEGKTIFLCSHLLAEVQQVCTRVAFIRKGAIVREGNMDALLNAGHDVIIEVDDMARGWELLRALPGVQEVRAESLGMRLISEEDIVSEVAAAVVQAGLRLRRLQPAETSLEAIYMQIFGADAHAEGAMYRG